MAATQLNRYGQRLLPRVEACPDKPIIAALTTHTKAHRLAPMGVIAHAEKHDGPGLSLQLVSGITAVIEKH